MMGDRSPKIGDEILLIFATIVPAFGTGKKKENMGGQEGDAG